MRAFVITVTIGGLAIALFTPPGPRSTHALLMHVCILLLAVYLKGERK